MGKPEKPTDIVMPTCERLDLFCKTLVHIRARTTTPYRLHVIDDASGYTKYLEELLNDRTITNLISHPKRHGIAANMLQLEKMTTSDPIVLTDDDVLCPKLEPDWLARGLAEMVKRPRLGLLALNNPQCNIDNKRKQHKHRDETVAFCTYVGGTFLFIRRHLLEKIEFPGKKYSPIKVVCRTVHELGYQVGYLIHVYCQHIGAISVRRSYDCSDELEKVCPVDNKTLEPPDAYKG